MLSGSALCHEKKQPSTALHIYQFVGLSYRLRVPKQKGLSLECQGHGHKHSEVHLGLGVAHQGVERLAALPLELEVLRQGAQRNTTDFEPGIDENSKLTMLMRPKSMLPKGSLPGLLLPSAGCPRHR